MASALRPTLLRSAMALPARRGASSIIPALRAQSVSRPSLALQKAAFQTSAMRALLPPLPQTVKGTLNDAAPVPHAEPTHGSYHWTFERGLSLALVPATLIPFAAGVGNPYLDSALIGGIILHSYIGFTSCITDYFPTWRVPMTRKIFEYLNILAVFVVGYGFYEFETNDVGLTEAVKKIWTA
ncbi:hypothetical protein AMS68_003067 [Peltaster fructicola]|uniref:Succinate dehydrogenase [ubiquinone] cytochrome b small subunit n=1 Tax=Peltaster fructicola TaxID=286661 RepID=A0A6H0XSW3_9PEZI|nr:hypothetical protein AMS68_003067 [Peltaster fructicola]